MLRSRWYSNFKLTPICVVATCVVWLLTFCASVALGDEEERVWTDSTGKFKITATLVSRDGDEVKLKRSDGKTIKMAVDKLSEKDRRYLDKSETQAPVEPEEAKKPAKDAARGWVGAASTTFEMNGETKRLQGQEIYVGDSSRAKEISLPYEPIPWSVRPSSLALPDDVKEAFSSVKVGEKFGTSGNGSLFVAGNGRFLIGMSTLGGDRESESTFSIVDASSHISGALTIPIGNLTPTDVSDDGNWALATFPMELPQARAGRKNAFIAFTAVDSSQLGQTVQPNAVFCPYYALVSNPDSEINDGIVEDVRWVGYDRIVTKSVVDVTLWDPSTCQAIYRVDLGNEDPVLAIDPARRLLALATKGRLVVLDADSGEPLGTVAMPFGYEEAPAPTEKKDENDNSVEAFVARQQAQQRAHHRAFSRKHGIESNFWDEPPVDDDRRTVNRQSSTPDVVCRFSPDGSQIAVVLNNKAAIVDLTSGEVKSTISCSGAIGRVCWVNGDYILLGSGCYNADKGFLIAKYSGLFSQSVYSDGLVWTTIDRGETLVGVKLPHQIALDAVEKSKSGEGFALYPGAKVAARAELNGLADDEAILKALEYNIQHSGFQYDKDSSVVLVAGASDTGEKMKVTGEEIDSRKTSNGGASSLQLETVTAQLKIFEQTLEIEVDGAVVYTKKGKTTGPDVIDRDRSVPLAQQMKEINKPDASFYQYSTLPYFLTATGERLSTKDATITKDGISLR